MSENSFGARDTLRVGDREYEIYRLDALQSKFDVARLPFSLKVLLENLLRTEDGVSVTAQDIEALATWDAAAEPSEEIAFTPARVLMQDFTGVPAVVDLAAMRDAMDALDGDASQINPLVPAELVIDHSVQVDVFGTNAAFERNAELEFERNQERYAFLRWGQGAFEGLKVVPPDTGIVHQVNLEYLARVVFVDEETGRAYPDTLVGTDSHTTMINGLGVLGWGVGGIEAEAAMLGQAMSMLIPQVVGFRLNGELPEGATATDLVLTVTQMLREHGVVGKFVEFHGPGLTNLPLADRATIGNMSPEFGSTCAIFPIDRETLRYLEFSGRPKEQIELVEAYCREQGIWHDEDSEATVYSESLELDLDTVVPSLAGPKRPQDRVPLSDSKEMFREALTNYVTEDVETQLADAHDEAVAESFPSSDPPSNGHPGHSFDEDERAPAPDSPSGGGAVTVDLDTDSSVHVELDGETFELDHGHVVIAAITSCTNTSNPSVMLGAGVLARNAVQRGLEAKPWVKTSLAPGSKVVTEYLDRAGLTEYLEALRFHLVGYGCTTCIGNSGPLPPEISKAVDEGDLAVVSVLSGNRNFEGRINQDVKMNYLASPPLCVAYALAGTMDIDLYSDPLGVDRNGKDVFLRDLWPTEQEVHELIEEAVQSDMFRKSYAEVFDGDERWNSLDVPTGDRFEWDPDSTYVRRAPFFDGIEREPAAVEDISGARVLAVLGDSVTTDHISPAGSIKKDSPAGRYLQEHGVAPKDFNSYGSRRGNHEVMMRGTFANIRLRNLLAPGTEGGVTIHLDSGEEMPIYDAAMRYAESGTPLVVLAGKEYGSGSSRDWAAKGTKLLGVRAVIARSYERIHRSNLVGMGVVPLQFMDGESVESLGLTGKETFSISGLGGGEARSVTVDAGDISFEARVRIDTPKEVEYFRHGGILNFVLRRMLGS
ncbi:MAG: aconitate hydratase [Solirubrobacteraceae bacterium]|jgi:aconitate hydratase|nr:aconitate hydratase [Solirubrobacteraceae bacterium]